MIFIYNVLFILLLGLFMKNNIETSKGKKIYLIIVFFQMALIQGLRDITVGTDTALYVNTYNNYLSSEYYSFQFSHFEPIFRFICDVCHRLNFSSTHFLLLISSITMFGFAYFIYKNSKNVVLSVFLFACLLYPNSLNIMRQYLALSISINAYNFFLDKKYFKGFLLILFSSFIHSTSLILLLLIPLNYLKKTKTKILILIFLLPIFYLLGDYIVYNTLNLVGKSYYATRYYAGRVFRLTTFITFLSFMLIELFRKYCNDEKKEISLLSNICLLNVFFGILYLKYEYFSRIIELFNSFLIISIPLGMKYKFYLKPIIRIMIILISFLLMTNSVFNSGSGIENYKFYFS